MDQHLKNYYIGLFDVSEEEKAKRTAMALQLKKEQKEFEIQFEKDFKRVMEMKANITKQLRNETS